MIYTAISFNIFSDIWIGKQTLREKQRRKRIIPVVAVAGGRIVWAAGRYLLKSLIKNSLPVIKKSSGKITKIYFKRGGYRSAVKDFKRFKATDIKTFTRKNVSAFSEIITVYRKISVPVLFSPFSLLF